jgi:hypothetical protein
MKNNQVNQTENTFQLKKKPAIAPRGLQKGTFASMRQECPISEKGKQQNTIIISIELQAKDTSNNPYIVEKTYNMDGRGLTLFSEDFASWSGRELTLDEAEEFQADKLLLKRPVNVAIEHRKNGSKLVPVISKFLPTEELVEEKSN